MRVHSVTAKSELHGDRPLDPSNGDQDRLGFTALGQRLADAITSDVSDDGLVIGIEGAWGSGKSSLTALTKQALNSKRADVRPEVVDFRPWLIGNRDGLLAALFADLHAAIDQISLRGGDATRVSMTTAASAGKKLTAFASRLEPFGNLLALGGPAHPGFLLLSSVVKIASKAAKEATKGPSLDKLKRELNDDLSKLKVKIVVVIDDVDRLEPAEAIELLRLVRSVADFSNIVYVMCFDPRILSHAVQVGANIDNGKAYLEKIVQVTIPVPTPEPFLLRHWFESEVKGLFEGISDESAARLRRVIDAEGGRQMKTPRSVVRSLNAVSFAWAALRNEVDEADLVWLQLIRTGAPDLYRWIEGYVSTLSVTRGPNVSIDAANKSGDLQRLKELVSDDDREINDVLSGLSEHLLGITVHEPELYTQVHSDSWRSAINHRRLASPEHYRLYFAYELPPMALTDDESQSYAVAVAHSSDALATILKQFASQIDGTGLTKAQTLLERLQATAGSTIPGTDARNHLLAFADIMDELVTSPREDSWLGPSAWRQAERLLPMLLNALPAKDRREVLIAMFANGRSISWLTSIFRTEYFSHGRFGSQKRAPDDWLMSDDELDAITPVVISRFQSLGLGGLGRTLRPASAIFAWMQMGPDTFEPALNSALSSDDTFVSLIRALSSKVSSSGGNYVHVSSDSLTGINLSSEETAERLEGIISSADDDLANEARQALAWVNASDW